MSRHYSYLLASTLWTLAIILLIFRTSFPTVELRGPALPLALGVALGCWVVYVSALTGSTALWRAAQATNFAIPLVWALWVDVQAGLMMESVEYLALAMVSLLANVAQNPWLRRAQKEDLAGDPIPEPLLAAVKPVIAPLPPVFETGSLRLPISRIPHL